jgi:starch synthase
MSKMKILYVTHEMTPYHQLTDMADSARELPQKMQDKDMEVRVFMPRFGSIKERKHRLHEVIRLSGINVPVGDDDNPLIIKVASLPSAKMQIYFLDNEDFYQKRDYLHDEKNNFYADNDERTIFFNKGVIEIIHKLGWVPDVIHCQGWMSGLVAMYARTVLRNEPMFKNTKFIYTVFENTFTETMGKNFVSKAIVNGQDKEHFAALEDPGIMDFYRAGIKYADAVTIGSPDVDSSLQSYIHELNKPFLAYQEKDSGSFSETHYEFYQSLLEDSVLAKSI